MKDYVLGIDIGGTNLRLGAVNASCEVSFFERMPSPPILTGDAVGNLTHSITDYVARHGLNGQLAAVSVGVPGSVSRDKSFVYSVPKLPSLQNRDLGQELSERLGLPVFIDRDVNYLLMNDIMQLGLDPDRDKTILGFYIGTGLGNAVYVNGQLVAGKHGVAGELGHIPLYRLDRRCDCGNVGCCETLCSGSHMAELVQAHFPGCAVGDVFTLHGDDPVMLDFIDTLALPLASEITILDPDYIILGGGVVNTDNFPTERLLESVRRHTRAPYPQSDLNVRMAENSQACGVKGGAYVAFQRLAAAKK